MEVKWRYMVQDVDLVPRAGALAVSLSRTSPRAGEISLHKHRGEPGHTPDTRDNTRDTRKTKTQTTPRKTAHDGAQNKRNHRSLSASTHARTHDVHPQGVRNAR